MSFDSIPEHHHVCTRGELRFPLPSSFPWYHRQRPILDAHPTHRASPSLLSLCDSNGSWRQTALCWRFAAARVCNSKIELPCRVNPKRISASECRLILIDAFPRSHKNDKTKFAMMSRCFCSGHCSRTWAPDCLECSSSSRKKLAAVSAGVCNVYIRLKCSLLYFTYLRSESDLNFYHHSRNYGPLRPLNIYFRYCLVWSILKKFSWLYRTLFWSTQPLLGKIQTPPRACAMAGWRKPRVFKYEPGFRLYTCKNPSCPIRPYKFLGFRFSGYIYICTMEGNTFFSLLIW